MRNSATVATSSVHYSKHDSTNDLLLLFRGIYKYKIKLKIDYINMTINKAKKQTQNNTY